MPPSGRFLLVQAFSQQREEQRIYSPFSRLL
jgi:hypothetical protein